MTELQAVNQEAGQQAQSQVQAQGQQAVPGATAAEPGQPRDDGVHLPYRQFEGLGYGRDFNKVIHAAKRFQELERLGYVRLADQVANTDDLKELDGYQIMRGLMENPEQAAQDNQQQVVLPHQAPYQQPAYAGVNPHTGQPYSGYPGIYPQQYDAYGNPIAQDPSQRVLTFAEAEKEWARREEALLKKVDERFETAETHRRSAQETAAAVQAEERAYRDELRKMGFSPNPQKTSWMGRDGVEYDREFEDKLKVLRADAVELHRSRLNRNDPDFERNWNPDAIDTAIIKEAARYRAPYWQTQGQADAEKLAQSQADVPGATVPTGPGGRAQTGPEEFAEMDMGDPRFAAEARRRARKKGTLTLADDEE